MEEPEGGDYDDEGYNAKDDPQLNYLPTPFPAWHSQNEYDTAPDFADWDDFFESPALHNLEDILEDYSVVISYSGSRFYATIIAPDRELEDIFPPDYHAFWSESFDEDRTFIISDTTFASSPVGTDFFEMRRRIDNSMFSKHMNFNYGPFGALIPLMNYEGTGFFHCLDETSHPSTSPSSSGAPTSTSIALADACIPVEVNILSGDSGGDINWSISQIADGEGGMHGGILPIESLQRYFDPLTGDSHPVCLHKGVYEFTIMIYASNGKENQIDRARYILASNGEDIVDGEIFPQPILTVFSIPVLSKYKPSA